jgi:hypothetical protein
MPVVATVCERNLYREDPRKLLLTLLLTLTLTPPQQQLRAAAAADLRMSLQPTT